MKHLLKIPIILFVLILSSLGLVFCFFAFIVLSSPDVSELKGCMKTSMFEVDVCPGSANYVTYNQLPEDLVNSLIVSEDAAFFSHSGFDWYELRASLEKNIEKKAIKRGGSTLTQQLAKNAFLSPKKSVWRKLREAYLTQKIESEFSKTEILEKYFNMVEFGKDLYGIKKASQHYFQKHPRDIHLLEATFLVMLLPNPVAYSQSFREGRLTPYAKRMINIILRRLVTYGKISKATFNFAQDNIDSFPWAYLSQADFRMNLPDLPEDLSGTFSSDQIDADEVSLQEEIEKSATEALEQLPEETENSENTEEEFIENAPEPSPEEEDLDY